jgi:hypothetical protein
MLTYKELKAESWTDVGALRFDRPVKKTGFEQIGQRLDLPTVGIVSRLPNSESVRAIIRPVRNKMVID